jgi:secreted trypsin-like serine protease
MRNGQSVTSPDGDRWRVKRRWMNRRAMAALAAGLIWAAGASSAAASPGFSAQASVVGGRPASIAEFPSMAFLTGGPGLGAFFCTATVVAPRVVLTAGHCVDNIASLGELRLSNYRVTTGVANVLHPPSADISKVTAAFAYPGFDPETLFGDAGLLILAQPVAVPPIALASPAAPVPLPVGTPLQLAGWGFTDLADEHVSNVLQTGEIAAQSSRFCRRHSREFDPYYSTSLQICGADLRDEIVSGCYGDSGGPAIARSSDGSPVEVGIVSAGGLACGPTEPNLFTRVEALADWIEGWIAAVETGAPAPVGPQTKLPPMTTEHAFEIYMFSIFEILGAHGYGNGNGYDSSCHRIGRSKVSCGETWTHPSALFLQRNHQLLGDPAQRGRPTRSLRDPLGSPPLPRRPAPEGLPGPHPPRLATYPRART